MVLCHDERVHVVHDLEVVLALRQLEQVLLLVLTIPPEALVVPREGALSRNDVWLKVPLVVHTVRGSTVLLRGKGAPHARRGQREQGRGATA
eukprot:3954621-Alexandrium_andersonii.AAC.1